MAKSVMCLVADAARAQAMLSALRGAGFSNDSVSVLLPDKARTRDFAHEHGTKAPEGAVAGAGAGAAVGGAMGWLAGIGSLAIPGLGPFIAAGPILAALSGAAMGAAAGGLAGALIGMGVPEFEAKQYAGKLEGGNVLISVHAENADEIARAKEVLERNGAQSVAVTREASVPEATDDER